MAIKIGINGFGRIGKLVFRAAVAEGIDVVGINDLMPPESLAYFLKYDSTQGRFNGTVEAKDKAIVVNGKEVPATAIKDPAELPWGERGADVVVEATGIFATTEACEKHITAGAKKVLLTVPPKDKGKGKIKVVVLGVNDDQLTAGNTLVSNASCTTNCLAPMAKVLHDNFGIENGLMTTCHAYTNDQNILDAIHSKLRRSRAAAVSIIPTTTGAAKAVGVVMPELNGKLDGLALRVPTPDGSITDLVATLKKKTTGDEVNAAMKKASEGELKGVLAYNDEPIVSADIIGNPASCIFDAPSTNVIAGTLVKVLGWYDNEWGYSSRCIDLIKKMTG